MKRKIIDIEDDIKKIIVFVCDEKFWISWYGAYDIDPKHLVFWICVETDEMKLKLQSNITLINKLRNLLIKHNYPEQARPFVYIDFESQETVDRESRGNWYHHFK
ncbi:MAG: hypothetical protein LBL04_03210 [Bacteroidales bacterium]|jgi:hypothetical protein|nr:hypothetical protein [Bacteroidales bacterium]